MGRNAAGIAIPDNHQDIEILLLDDDQAFVGSMQELLTMEGYLCYGSTDPQEVMGRIEVDLNKAFILIIDYLMVGITALSVIEQIRSIKKNLHVIMLTGFSQNMPGLYAMKHLDIDAYCVKSPDMDPLLIQIESAIKTIRKFSASRGEVNDGLQFHERLRYLRVANDMTQEEIGDQLGVGRTTVANYEQGRIRPTLESVVKLSRLFGVSCDYLLSDLPNENPRNEE